MVVPVLRLCDVVIVLGLEALRIGTAIYSPFIILNGVFEVYNIFVLSLCRKIYLK